MLLSFARIFNTSAAFALRAGIFTFELLLFRPPSFRHVVGIGNAPKRSRRSAWDGAG